MKKEISDLFSNIFGDATERQEKVPRKGIMYKTTPKEEEAKGKKERLDDWVNYMVEAGGIYPGYNIHNRGVLEQSIAINNKVCALLSPRTGKFFTKYSETGGCRIYKFSMQEYRKVKEEVKSKRPQIFSNIEDTVELIEKAVEQYYAPALNSAKTKRENHMIYDYGVAPGEEATNLVGAAYPIRRRVLRLGKLDEEDTDLLTVETILIRRYIMAFNKHRYLKDGSEFDLAKAAPSLRENLEAQPVEVRERVLSSALQEYNWRIGR